MATTTESPESILAPVQEDGKFLESRIKNVSSANEAYKKMREADRRAASERARIQSMIDGESPYDQDKLEANGLGEICNVNWGMGEQLLVAALAPYVDIIRSVENLCTMPTNFGEVQERADWENIMADEFTRMVREHPEFDPKFQFMLTHYLAHGVVFAFREDEIDWRWSVSPIGDFLIPRNTRASDEEIEISALSRGMAPHELYQKIKDPEMAKDLGWNVAATRKAIMRAANSKSSTREGEDWEVMQREFKNNDIGVSASASASEVRCIFMWVRELDGTITMLMFEKDAEDKSEFLYQHRSKYENVSQAFNSFCYGVGTNGHFHSIRGLGSKIFATVEALNRLRCRFYDSLMMSSMQILRASSEDALENMGIVNFGPYTILPDGLELVKKDDPNFNQSLIPGIQDLGTLLAQQSGQYTTEAVFNQTREQTKYQVQAHMESLANLSIAALSMFYSLWQRLIRETVRRVIRQDYYPTDPGGKEVAEFKARCQMRGVPLEAIHAVDFKRVEVIRAVGSGSSAARSAIMRQLFELSANFDPEGRQYVIRDLTRSIAGKEAADRYTPAPKDLRPPMEVKTAMLENNQLKMGMSIPVIPNELHSVHFPIHKEAADEITLAVDEGRALIEEAMPQLAPIYEHLAAHAEFSMGTPDYPMQKQYIQQLGEIVTNGIKRMEKIQRQQQEEQMQAEAAGVPDATVANPSGAPDVLQNQLTEARVRLEVAEEDHKQKLRHKEEDHLLSQRLKDAETAAKIVRDSQA